MRREAREMGKDNGEGKGERRRTRGNGERRKEKDPMFPFKGELLLQTP